MEAARKSVLGRSVKSLLSYRCAAAALDAEIQRGCCVMRSERQLLDVIVGCFARDDDVVHVTFPQACAGDADEPRIPLLSFCVAPLTRCG